MTFKISGDNKRAAHDNDLNVRDRSDVAGGWLAGVEGRQVLYFYLFI